MLFWSTWIPLTPENVEAQLSDIAGLYEVKVDGRLVDYPVGRSAMVYYGKTTPEEPSLRRLVLRDWFTEEKRTIRSNWEAFGALVMRWTAADANEAEHARRMKQFVDRFGRPPWGNPES